MLCDQKHQDHRTCRCGAFVFGMRAQPSKNIPDSFVLTHLVIAVQPSLDHHLRQAENGLCGSNLIWRSDKVQKTFGLLEKSLSVLQHCLSHYHFNKKLRFMEVRGLMWMNWIRLSLENADWSKRLKNSMLGSYLPWNGTLAFMMWYQ